ncbi:MAG TPA: methyltransferase domain-containing protein [Candidatus Tectomicrobia bacterium]|nr:methyltransferase domain-containing protein [Candidatus Tectomicrobia bacterium]
MTVEQNRTAVARFDRWARTYDDGQRKPWFLRGQAAALDAAGLQEDDRLLDVGCGTGSAVIAAARRPVARACGIDVSPEMIVRARRNADGLAGVEFRVADAEAIPYPDATFTAVICTNSFHHYSEPLRALAELRRVLAPGGRLVVLDPDRAGCLWVWCWDRILRVAERSHVRYYTAAELLDLVRTGGFADVRLLAADHGHWRHGKIGWASALIRGDHRPREGGRS